MKRHMRDNYYVVGEGILTHDYKGQPISQRPSTTAALRKFRFSRLGPEGVLTPDALRAKLAEAMTAPGQQPDSANPSIPAGFTYLGQFVDHDLTMDKTATTLGDQVTVEELIQGRSPALDLDALYGRGPDKPQDRRFYADDGVKLKVGKTAPVPIDASTNRELVGFDLPRVGFGSTKAARRMANIPDPRNDENLAVAQTHLAFIRFHNRVVDVLAGGGIPSAVLFEAARTQVVKHYQWMLRTDMLPRLVDPTIIDDVFTNGRKFFEVPPQYDPDDPYTYVRPGDKYIQPGDTPTMPIEFSVAAYRLGHAMVRGEYQWNRIFNANAPFGVATLLLLFQFSGTSGVLSPGNLDLEDPEAGNFEVLPTNWVADFRRLYDFAEAGRNDLTVPPGDFNITKRIDTLLVDPLRDLPSGSFGGRDQVPPPQGLEFNLAFRNLTRANMVSLASGQQTAEFLQIDDVLQPDQLLNGNGGAALDALSEQEKTTLVTHTPLLFYVLREAELNGGRLTGVGGRIVAEVFHRAMEGSRISILRDPTWRPTLGPDTNTFRMVDLLLFAFEGNPELLNPLG